LRTSSITEQKQECSVPQAGIEFEPDAEPAATATATTEAAAHLQKTNEQLKRLEQCLEGGGESTSTLKDTAQSAASNAMAMAHSVAGDEILNNAFENFEIAAYRSLLALCPAAGMDSARAQLEASLKEEERMAA
jgi:ferritin-like metal-binding protein YciE